MKKVRLTVYLDPTVYDNLRAYAAARRQPMSISGEAAIAAFVDPDQRDADTTRRLGRIERQLERLARDSNISLEAFMVYLWLWLGANPPFPDALTAAARASVAERYDQFMETLGQRLASGKASSFRKIETGASDA